MLLGRHWRYPKVLYGLYFLEFAGTVAALAFFGIAAPNLYRTKLWTDGHNNGFNSDPAEVLYAYANYRPIPKTPLVWSQFLTSFNVVMSVFTMFVLLIKVVMTVMHIFIPLLSFIVHGCLVALWSFSVYGQAGPDKSDPKHPSSVAWYIAKSCSVCFDKSNYHYCELAKGSFAVTAIMLGIFVLHLPLSIHSLVPTAEAKARHARNSSLESHDIKGSPDSELTVDQRWEQENPPATPGKNPVTPRTRAFHTLSGTNPFRK